MTMTDETDTVADRIEATVRRMMTKRAGLADVWQHRVERRALMAEVNDLLEKYNLLTLGR